MLPIDSSGHRQDTEPVLFLVYFSQGTKGQSVALLVYLPC
jgi:hypothetical protein